MTFNRLDPMNHSMYLEDNYPSNIQEACEYVSSFPQADGPKLQPQPTKDSWYYKNDGVDDGNISTLEKIKAFVKGGTYNMIRGMFCNENGFSLGRTLTTAAVIGAIALTGPIGAAVAGGVGLLAAAGNFIGSAIKAKNATTDNETRKAYEGFGESATTAGLSLWGGLKGLKTLKQNFNFGKMFPQFNLSLWNKLTSWNILKKININLGGNPYTQPEPHVITLQAEPVSEAAGTQQLITGPKQQALLESPEVIHNRMVENGQFNLPMVRPKPPKLQLPPIETFLNDGRPQFKLPPQVIEAPEASAATETVAKPVKARKTGPKKKSSAKKTTTTRQRKTKKAPANINTAQARSYTDNIRNLSTEPNPDVEYFYYGAPTKTHPNTDWGESNHFFG